MSITVVDSIMGSGKSTWAFNFINSDPQKKYLYVTPFIDECTRAVSECRSVNMVQPWENPTKQADFKKHIAEGKSIATTHSLFCQLSLSAPEITKIQEAGYILVIDEVFETVQVFDKLTKKEINFLKKNGYISIEDDGKILPAKEKTLSDLEGTAYEETLPYIKSGSLISFKEKILLRIFPIETLSLSKEIYILTYLFDASHLKHTLEMNNLQYKKCWIDEDGDLTDVQQDYINLKRQLKELIRIYDGKMNECGEDKFSLSATKWKTVYSQQEKDQIANHARSFFTYGPTRQITPEQNCMWAVYGETRKTSDSLNYNKSRTVNVSGYSMSCVPFNERATNLYRECYKLAYLVNIFEHREIKKWFETKNVKLNDDLFALSTMLQWIWRSRIRDGKEIYLYLPSKRMRKLLTEWLDQ